MNWDDGVGAAVTGIATFTGPANGGSTADCQGMSGTGFGAISIDANYGGRITFSGPVSTNMFGMAGGTIDQPGPGSTTDLTVTGYFGWSGGTINSTTNLANLILSGATGSIYGGGTVNLGSNLNLTNAANLTLGAVTTLVTNSIGINIGANCGINVDPGQSQEYDLKGNVAIKPEIDIGQSGYLRLVSGTAPLQSAVYNHGGEFTLMAGTTMQLNSDLGEWVWDPNFGWRWLSDGLTYDQTGGVTQLYNGSTLQVALDMQIAGGGLWTRNQSRGDTATITGNLDVTGGDIYIDAGNSNHNYGTLKVDGNVSWTGGTYHPVVEGDLDWGPADRWWATGTFMIGGGAALAPAALDYEGTPIMPVSGYHWAILQADGFFTDNTQPSYNNAIWGMDLSGDNVEWDLRAV